MGECRDCGDKVRPCGQTSTPTVDNSDRRCTKCGYISSECVITNSAIRELNIPEGAGIDEVINSLVVSLVEARQRIQNLENNA